MSESLKVVMVFLSVVLGTVCIVGVIQEDQRRAKLSDTPSAVSVKTLEADPDFYRDKLVRISTGGFQPGDDAHQLVYRHRNDFPPVVLLVFVGPISDPLPKHVAGLCKGRIGNRVVVEGCRPARD